MPKSAGRSRSVGRASESATSIARAMGHSNATVTLGIYGHWFAKRQDSGLGSRLEAFLEREVCPYLTIDLSQHLPPVGVIAESGVRRPVGRECGINVGLRRGARQRLGRQFADQVRRPRR